MNFFIIAPKARLKPRHAALAVAVILGVLGLAFAIWPRAMALPGS